MFDSRVLKSIIAWMESQLDRLDCADGWTDYDRGYYDAMKDARDLVEAKLHD